MSSDEAVTEDVDLVITDYAMPKVTGLVLAQEIEARYPDLPVILLTAWTHLESAVDLVTSQAARNAKHTQSGANGVPSASWPPTPSPTPADQEP